MAYNQSMMHFSYHFFLQDSNSLVATSELLNLKLATFQHLATYDATHTMSK